MATNFGQCHLMVTKKALIAIVLVATETFSITIKTHAPFLFFFF
jgi:hypothetical protein